MRITQEEKIMNVLKAGGSINAIEAFYIRITQLNTRICLLRKKGYPIMGEYEKATGCFRYWLDPEYFQNNGKDKVHQFPEHQDETPAPQHPCQTNY